MAIFRERSCYPESDFPGTLLMEDLCPCSNHSCSGPGLRESASILQNCVCTLSVFPSATPEEKLVMTQNRVAEMNVNPNDTDTLDTGRGWNTH